jgi:hypothetical protein
MITVTTLHERGYVMFPDGWRSSIEHIAAWIKANKKNYRFIEATPTNLILVQKIGADTRDWRDLRISRAEIESRKDGGEASPRL